MAESTVHSSALWLGNLLVEEIKCLESGRENVEKLRTELSALAAFLNFAVKSHRQDEGIQNTLSEAQNIAYDCEDVIDTYISKVFRHGYEEYEGCHPGTVMRWACLLKTAVSMHGIRSKIDELNQRISALKDRMTSYGVTYRINNYERETSDASELSLRRIFTHESKEQHLMVGFDEYLNDLLQVVTNSTFDTTVIAICGMGGIGKSTLARELYHKLREDVSLKAFGWVTASQQLQPDRVLRTLLYSLVPENDHERRMKIEHDIKADRAHRALYDLMGEFKCLVVIDDIWTSKDWAKLQAAFPKRNAVGSKVLLTTRNKKTISGLDPVHLHHIKGLDEKMSWDLFVKTAFPEGEINADSKKEELGREMLRHCCGVPLAIVVLGKALSQKEDWEQIRNDITKKIWIGGAHNVYKEVYDVLQVSYDELPPRLKPCFLYLANFPEDYEISTTKLYQMWVAEGIVAKENPNESDDIAEGHLNDLVERNMVQATRDKGTGTIGKCRLHDLMRDVCIKIAKGEGFVQVVNCQNPTMLSRNDKDSYRRLMTTLIAVSDKRIRRLAVYIGNQELNISSPYPTTPVSPSPKDVSRAPNLRSLLLFPVNNEQLGDGLDCKGLIETISVDYPLLRVFDCENLPLKGKLTKNIKHMIHLRYLGLANTLISELSRSIGKLQWLQTLDLRVDHSVELAIPNVLYKMKQLKHIYFPDDGSTRLADMERTKNTSSSSRYSIKNKEDLLLKGLLNLQTLLHIDLDKVDIKGLSQLIRLKTIKANCERDNKALHPLLQCSSTTSFELTIHAKIINKEPMILSSCVAKFKLHIYAEPNTNFRLSKPLCLEIFPRNMVSLAIWYIQLDRDPLPVLEKLPYLADLRLVRCFNGPMMICSAGGFPQLVSLSFYKLLSFRYWEVERGALCKLKNVLMVDCCVRKPHPEALPKSVNVNVHDSG